MRIALFAALIAPLALFGCKKKDPEPAPVAAAVSTLSWFFGPATFDGNRADGAGMLFVPFTVTNSSSNGLQLTMVGLTVMNGEDKTCTGKMAVSEKAPPGGEISGKLAFACDYSMLPSVDQFDGKAFASYLLGADEKEEKFPVTFTFKR